MNLPLLWASIIALLAVVAVLAFVVAENTRKISSLNFQLRMLRGPVALGGMLKSDELPTLQGRSMHDERQFAWADFMPDGTGVVILLNSGCAPCRTLARELARSRDTTWGKVAVVLLEGDGRQANTMVQDAGLDRSAVVRVDREGIEKLFGRSLSPVALRVRGWRIVDAVQVYSLGHLGRPGVGGETDAADQTHRHGLVSR